jgi:EpsI family protein
VRFGVEPADTFLEFSGALPVFLFSSFLIFIMARILEPGAGVSIDFRKVVSVDGTGMGARFTHFLSAAAAAPLVVAALLTAVASASYLLAPSRSEVTIERSSFSTFPPDLESWQGTRIALDPHVEGVLRADDYVSATYYDLEEKAPVDFWSAYYLSLEKDGSGIHSPEVCLPGGGWTIADLTTETIHLGAAGFQTLEVKRAIIRKGNATQLVYFWLEGRGRSMTGEATWKLYSKWDGFVAGRRDGALVRATTPMLADETEANADARLRRFLKSAVPHLRRFIPEI